MLMIFTVPIPSQLIKSQKSRNPSARVKKQQKQISPLLIFRLSVQNILSHDNEAEYLKKYFTPQRTKFGIKSFPRVRPVPTNQGVERILATAQL
ncbi:hypothetical protein WN55_11136 [Dufourea novaeangliae]|uniref:Uncharacterized protein n=1 Tax=Dufourea novaeangliae TaxID=178035 RepID=A0A154PC48_DUFNO|nr:hypothetical protein WN55_11136 [Dufourea novaeangliae]